MPDDKNDNPPTVEPPAPPPPSNDDSPKGKLKETVDGPGGLLVQFHRGEEKSETIVTGDKRGKKS